MEAVLAVDLAEASTGLWAEHATAVAMSVDAAIAGVGTRTHVRSRNSTLIQVWQAGGWGGRGSLNAWPHPASSMHSCGMQLGRRHYLEMRAARHAVLHALQAKLSADAAERYASRQLLLLEVNLYECGGEGGSTAGLPSPQCEQQLLLARLEQLQQSQTARQSWEAAGEAHWPSLFSAEHCCVSSMSLQP
jgi:hypothetical protein